MKQLFLIITGCIITAEVFASVPELKFPEDECMYCCPKCKKCETKEGKCARHKMDLVKNGALYCRDHGSQKETENKCAECGKTLRKMDCKNRPKDKSKPENKEVKKKTDI